MGICEYPIPIIKSLLTLPFAGGFYFRVMPLFLIKIFVNKYFMKFPNKPIVFYFHPWEFDKGLRKVFFNHKISLLQTLRHIIGTKHIEQKLEKLIKWLINNNASFVRINDCNERIESDKHCYKASY
jgi:peptidoglycan-N-acetylglucosamine deacetylase